MKLFIGTIRTKVLLFLTLSLFTGCATKEYVQTQSAVIVFKTPNFKYSDAAFIRFSHSSVTLELYEASQATATLTVTPVSVCQNRLCMSAREFNQKYLHTSYPDNTLFNVLNGFNISKELQKEDVSYSVDTKSVRFSDRKNGILIKIRNL